MLFLDVFSIAVATIGVMIILQVVLFTGIKLMYPPPPQIIYRTIPQQAPQQMPQEQPHVTFTEPPSQQISLPQYEPRQSTSTSARLDSELPDGLKETRPDGI